MYRNIKRLTVCAFAAGYLLLAGRPASAQSGAPVVSAINTYRAANGRSTLTTHAALARAAEKYALFLANRDQTSAADWHQVDGRTPAARAAAEGYAGGIWENVQLNWGHADPAGEALRWWKSSPGHNDNMLNPGHTVIGAGAARSASGKWFFVAMFGNVAMRTPPVTDRPPSTKPPLPPSKTLQKVTVKIQNRTAGPMTFEIEGRKYTLAAGHTGTYWHSKVGPVHYGWSWTGSMSGGGGAGILSDRTSYAFVLDGGGRSFIKTGKF